MDQAYDIPESLFADEIEVLAEDDPRKKLHRLTEKNIEARTATCSICGPGAPISKRRKYWACRIRLNAAKGSRGPNYTIEAWRKYNGNPRHFLLDKNVEKRTGICSICGPVKLRKQSNGVGLGFFWRCGTKTKQEERQHKKTPGAKRRRNALTTRSKGRQTESARAWAASLCKDACGICGKLEEEVVKVAATHSRSGKKVRGLQTDHDHITGLVRGLLCAQCNKGIGMFRDSQELLQKAWEYLLTHQMLRDAGESIPVWPVGTKAHQERLRVRALGRVVDPALVKGLGDLLVEAHDSL